MKRLSYVLAALMMLLTLPATAQTIHWLTFIDTTDGNVGKIDIAGREVLYNRFIGLVNAALQDKGYKTSIHDIYGARLTPQACKNELENLRVGPDDVIVFYYIGHGGRSTDDKTQWPQMQMAQDYDEGFIPLEWVHKTLKGKNARLAVTIGMCCNSYTRGLSAKNAPVFTPNFGNTYMSQSEIDNLAKLFDGYKGDIILSSSTPGQTSGCLGYNDKVIDAFTACLAVSTEVLMDGKIEPEWNTFLSLVKEMVAHYSKEIRNEDQTVQFVPNVTAKPVKQEQTQNQQQKPQTSKQAPKEEQREQAKESSTSRDEILDYFTNLFNGLLNRNFSDDDRIEAAEDFCNNNPEVSKIQVFTLGQDSDKVVGRQSLEDFIGRLATTRIMQSVSVSGITDRGIEVREVFRR